MKSKLFVEEWLVKDKWVALGYWVDQSFRNLLDRLREMKHPGVRRIKRIKTPEEFESLDKTHIVNHSKDLGWLKFIKWETVA